VPLRKRSLAYCAADSQSISCRGLMCVLLRVAGVPVAARPSVARQSTLRSGNQVTGAGQSVLSVNGHENAVANDVAPQKSSSAGTIFTHLHAYNYDVATALLFFLHFFEHPGEKRKNEANSAGVHIHFGRSCCVSCI